MTYGSSKTARLTVFSVCVSLLAACSAPQPSQPAAKAPAAAPVAVQAPAATPQAAVQAEPEPIEPLSLPVDLDPAKVALGEKLFHDKRLSGDDTISCASCHALDTGGVDRAKVSTGVGGVTGPVNAPTVFNSGLNFVQFWDGRAKDLEEQAAGPVHNPKEMASNWEQVTGKLKADPEIVAAFAKSYPDGLTGDNIARAIAEFEKSLVTADSRFDKYLRGDKTALTPVEIEGYGLFKGKGCTTCHNGPNVGGNSYQKLGVMKDYFADRGGVTEADWGRYNVTKDEMDRHFFKVPSLRVAALTPPYFHDASRETLEDAVRTMGRYQLGVELDDGEIAKIVAFLKSLVGNYQGKPLLPSP